LRNARSNVEKKRGSGHGASLGAPLNPDLTLRNQNPMAPGSSEKLNFQNVHHVMRPLQGRSTGQFSVGVNTEFLVNLVIHYFF
jgi:hypothetical protein